MYKTEIKFIVDESVDFPVVKYLRNKGFDVASIVEDHPSLEDAEILKIAFEENRILVANDKDFGYLIFKLNLKSRGVVLFRLQDQSSATKIKAMGMVLKNYLDRLKDNFVVVTENRVRIKKI